MSRFAVFRGGEHVIAPRLDALGPDRRLEPGSEVMTATLGGRQVVLAQPERTPGGMSYTVPLTMSRLRREYDLERGIASRSYEPSALIGIGQVASVAPGWKSLLLLGATVVIAYWFFGRDMEPT